MMRVVGKMISAVLMALALATPCVHAQPLTHEPTGIVLPEEIAGFRRIGHDDYETTQPGLGTGYNYNNGKGVVASVFIYTAGQGNIASGVDSAPLAHMREQSMREITDVVQGRGESAQHLAHHRLHVKTGRGDIPILFDAFAVSSPTGVREHFVKIRMTRLPKGELPPAQRDAFYEFVARGAAD
jgi:hypothetical protein